MSDFQISKWNYQDSKLSRRVCEERVSISGQRQKWMQGTTKNHSLCILTLSTLSGKRIKPVTVNTCWVMQTMKVRKWPSALTTFLWCLILEKVLCRFLESESLELTLLKNLLRSCTGLGQILKFVNFQIVVQLILVLVSLWISCTTTRKLTNVRILLMLV